MSETETPAPAAASSRQERARAFVQGLLEKLGVNGTVDSREAPDAIALSVAPTSGGEPLGLEPGRRGQVLEAIQYLTNRAVNRDPNDRKWVTVDVGAFRAATDEELLSMARRLAEKVKKIGKVVAVGPMNARERRQVHLAIAGDAGLRTQSEGEGLSRRLFIIPVATPARIAAPAEPAASFPLEAPGPEGDAPDSDDAD